MISASRLCLASPLCMTSRKTLFLVNWLKTGTWDYYAPARRKLVRETLVLKRKRTDDEIIADFKRRKNAEKVGQSEIVSGKSGSTKQALQARLATTIRAATAATSIRANSLRRIASLRRRDRSKDFQNL